MNQKFPPSTEEVAPFNSNVRKAGPEGPDLSPQQRHWKAECPMARHKLISLASSFLN